jgi:UPF0176 protein
MEYTVLLFYKYISIEDPETFAQEERERALRLRLTGRTIIAHEGLNATYEGTREATEQYRKELTADARFHDVQFKVSKGTGNAFRKLSVKVRKEIVSSHLGDDDVNPNEVTGKYLKPGELKKWYENGEEFVVVDMRNDFEFASGHFQNSIPSGMKNFRDLANATKKIEPLKNKKVLTVCTGGVRCEKASAYLVKKGFENVYQLEGGIVSYMEKYPTQEFKGTLYVFDNRLTMDFDDAAKHEVVGKCARCSSSSERYVNCDNDVCHLHYILCENCEKSAGLYCGTC